VAEIAEELRTVPHSRVPVYGESIDDITGVVYVREAYHALVSGREDESLRRIAREPFFLPGSVPLTRLLRDFQGRRIHLGIVSDEFGGTDGLVTLEDVLEELVGEIEDETDIREELVTRVSTSEIEVDGSTELRDVNAALGTELPETEYRSVNALLLEETGHVPVPGEQLEWEGIQLEVLESTETQVQRVRVRIAPAPTANGTD
jgi:putative hemolysin